jgi:cell wall-associated NlpC family hydrolase
MKTYRLLPALSPVALIACAALAGPAAAAPPPRWVDVSVATLWTQPGTARAIDKPSLSDPAHPGAWVDSMTVEQKRWLVGRLETQALYGTKVYLLQTKGSWSKIAVPSQPTPRNRLGYPGWVPTTQLTTAAPPTADHVAVVRRRTAWLWASPSWTGKIMLLSYGTRLRVASFNDSAVEVVLLDGRHAYTRRSVAALHAVTSASPKLTGDALVREAKRFLGLQYLWAGTSGFGCDCSGLTYRVFQALGKTLPRDAGAQSRRGVRIAARSSLRRGDLVFFRSSSGVIHHVGMYVGNGRMIHAPRTGAAVQITPLQTAPYASEFAGGRRFTP